MRAKVVAKAVIQNERGQVLLLRRSGTDLRRPHEWDFAGGGIDTGEEIANGVCREIREETGLDFTPAEVRLVYAATEAYESSQESVTRLLFTAHLTTEATVRLSFEHDQFKWVGIERAITDFPHPFYATGLRYAQEHDLLSFS